MAVGRLLSVAMPCIVQFYYTNLCGGDDEWRTKTIPGLTPFSNIQLNYTDCDPRACNVELPTMHCKDAHLSFSDADGMPQTHTLVDNSGSAVLIDQLSLGAGCLDSPAAGATLSPPPIERGGSQAPALPSFTWAVPAGMHTPGYALSSSRARRTCFRRATDSDRGLATSCWTHSMLLTTARRRDRHAPLVHGAVTATRHSCTGSGAAAARGHPAAAAAHSLQGLRRHCRSLQRRRAATDRLACKGGHVAPRLVPARSSTCQHVEHVPAREACTCTWSM